MRKRKHTSEFKAKIVLELLKEVKSINEICSENMLNPSLVARWRNQAISNLSEVFSDKNKKINDIKIEYESKLNLLYKEIGVLTTKLSTNYNFK
jgi:transposase